MEFLEYETTLAVCDSTIGHIIKQLFNDLPSALDIIKCTNLICKKKALTPIAVLSINIQITNGTEAASHPKMKLSNIPPVLIINEKAFELRGEKNKTCKNSTVAPCEYLVYSI
ncbi:unnamed protein product [Macrosiphum euphorbiae]|uniref:Uncharacterized protein n=1 Tax=Macrosiphum euphorbiae TaxID=13131 RepID=A0AAV0WC74_9HEMI|nr:unnamed protein product [Macrosiphum euphorbiae]